MRLFSVFGIEVRLDVSVVLIFGLIVYSLGAGLLPHWHPDWTAGLRWAIGTVGALTLLSGIVVALVMYETLPARRVER